MRFLNSVKSLYVAVGILFLTIGLGSYVDIRNEAMHARHLEINTGLERMVRLNQELTNMLAIAVLKNSALGTASYDTVKNDLQQTMARVTELTQAQNLLQEISSLSDSQNQLREIEAQSIQFITDDQWEKASGLLFGDDYMLARKTYEVDSEAAVGAVMGELALTAQRFAQVRNTALGLRIAALALLLWIGIMFSRKTRADLVEQMRLREEITVAYRDMEARVAERTSEVTAAMERLSQQQDALRESEVYNRMLFQESHRPIVIYDPVENGFIDCNAAAAKIYGYASREEVLGKTPLDVSAPTQYDGRDSKTASEQQDHSALAHGIETFEWRHQRPNGEIWDAMVYLMAFNYRGRSLLQFTLDDITEHKRNQAELQQRMDELERFNRLTMGREERMIQLKQEINGLLAAQGLPRRYKDLDKES